VREQLMPCPRSAWFFEAVADDGRSREDEDEHEDDDDIPMA
jgi:hypothetical protein